jgi:hypothetical protein
MSEQTLFTAALEREPGLRRAFLEQACGTDVQLRERVEKLLRLHDGARGFLEQPAASDIGLMLEHPPLELIDGHYYHLDTCFCPLAAGVAIWYPGAFDDYGRRALTELVPDLIEIAAAEAQSFACNAVVVGRHVVTTTGCPRLHAALAARGFTPHETPLSEFIKAGGSAKCLTLRLDGEEAAGWRMSNYL